MLKANVISNQPFEAGFDRSLDGLSSCDRSRPLEQLRVDIDESFGHEKDIHGATSDIQLASRRVRMFSWLTVETTR